MDDASDESQRQCVPAHKSRPLGRVYKNLPREPASLNAMKKNCVIVILAHLNLPDSCQNCTVYVAIYLAGL